MNVEVMNDNIVRRLVGLGIGKASDDLLKIQKRYNELFES